MEKIDELLKALELIAKKMNSMKQQLKATEIQFAENANRKDAQIRTLLDRLEDEHEKALEASQEENTKYKTEFEGKLTEIRDHIKTIAESTSTLTEGAINKKIRDINKFYKHYLERVSKNLHTIQADFENANKHQKDIVKGFFMGKAGVALTIALMFLCFFTGLGFNQGAYAKKAVKGEEEKIVKEHYSTLLQQRDGIVTLKELELSWAKRQVWHDRKAVIEEFEKAVETAKETYGKTK